MTGERPRKKSLHQGRFLEMFELVPHIWAWWVLPVWAIGLGLAQLWQKVRGA